MNPTNQISHISPNRCESCKSDCVISIIVPVYNAGDTIERCINSVISQDYPNWELILVDDGSQDDSPTICDNYAANDARIRVIHKVNGGVSSARNLGLEAMTGEWVCFLDSDDEFTKTCLSSFYSGVCEYNSDLIFHSDFAGVKNGRITHSHVADKTFFSSSDFPTFLDTYINHSFVTSVHANLFKVAFIRDNNLCFNSKIRAGEDHAFVLEYLRFCSSALITEGEGYIYYFPENFNLKYSQRIDEIIYRCHRLEISVKALQEKWNVDLSDKIRMKWYHGLYGINAKSLYNPLTFSKYKKAYTEHVGGDYKTDLQCNRESLVALTLMQIGGIKKFKNEYDNLISLFCAHTRDAECDVSSFPITAKVLCKIAIFKQPFLLRLTVMALQLTMKILG